MSVGVTFYVVFPLVLHCKVPAFFSIFVIKASIYIIHQFVSNWPNMQSLASAVYLTVKHDEK